MFPALVDVAGTSRDVDECRWQGPQRSGQLLFCQWKFGFLPRYRVVRKWSKRFTKT